MTARLCRRARHRHAGQQYERGNDQEAAADPDQPAQQAYGRAAGDYRGSSRLPAAIAIAGPHSMRTAASNITPAKMASWTGPGTQWASVAPAQAPTIPGRPNQATLRQSTWRRIA